MATPKKKETAWEQAERHHRERSFDCNLALALRPVIELAILVVLIWKL